MQVIIRIRPLSSSEISLQGHGRCVRQDSSQAITWTGHPESRFTFDLIADETVSQVNISFMLLCLFVHICSSWLLTFFFLFFVHMLTGVAILMGRGAYGGKLHGRLQ